jgi:hypothetical protein
MKRGLWIVCGVLTLAAVLAAMAGAALLLWVLPQELGTVTVDGRVLDLQSAHVGHWLLATMGLLLAMVMVMVVVPTVLLLVLAVPLTLAVFGLGVALLACMLVLSPLGLLVWWLWKGKPRAQTISP